MPHLVAEKTRAEATPVEWLKHGTEIAAFVNTRSERADIIAYLGEGAGAGHAACFCPSTAEIELDVEVAFTENVDPAWVGNVNERPTLFEWPKCAGALIHEASHARWTLWPLTRMAEISKTEKDRRFGGLIEYFEEIRIEKLAVETWPEDAAFLRSSALGIIMDGLDVEALKQGNPYEISRCLILCLGRVDAGILDISDVEALMPVFEEILTADKLPEFRSLVGQASRLADHDTAADGMIPIVRRWLELLPEEEPATDEEVQAMLAQIAELIAEAKETAEIGGADDAADQEEKERWEAQAKVQNEAAKQSRELERIAEDVFSKGTDDVDDVHTNSRITNRRPPKPEEHSAAVILARELEKARYRDRIRTETESNIPPGRLQTRDALEGMAQRATGQVVTARPWHSVHRKHTDDPELKIGIMCDISGSMSSAMGPMATSAWIMAEAGYRIQAQVAQVYYGSAVFPTLKPGQRMPEVVTRSAPDATERFEKAIKALMGKLDLLNGTGARLLVICSDTCYTYKEAIAFELWTKRLIEAGVAIIVMTYDYTASDFKTHEVSPKIQLLPDIMTPVKAATAIGQAAVKALETASNGR